MVFIVLLLAVALAAQMVGTLKPNKCFYVPLNGCAA